MVLGENPVQLRVLEKAQFRLGVLDLLVNGNDKRLIFLVGIFAPSQGSTQFALLFREQTYFENFFIALSALFWAFR